MNPVFISDDFSKCAIFPFSFTADCRFCCKITLTKNKRLYHSEFISLTHWNILFQRFVARSLKVVRSGETSQNKAILTKVGHLLFVWSHKLKRNGRSYSISMKKLQPLTLSVLFKSEEEFWSYSTWCSLYCSTVRTSEARAPDVLCIVQEWGGLLKLLPNPLVVASW